MDERLYPSGSSLVPVDKVVTALDSTDYIALLRGGAYKFITLLNLLARGVVKAAASTLAALDSGKTVYLNHATGFATTLPAPALGLRFKFVVAIQPTTGNHTVVTNGSSNVVEGMADVNSTLVLASNEDSINFVASTAIIGDWVEVESDGTSWFVTGQSGAAGGITFTAT